LDIEKELPEFLKGMITKDSSIKQLILVDRAGVPITHASREKEDPIDISSVGTVAMAVMSAIELQANDLKLGEVAAVSSDLDKGKIFVSALSNAILCMVSSPDANIGMIRHLIKSSRKELDALLKEFFSTERGRKMLEKISKNEKWDEELQKVNR